MIAQTDVLQFREIVNQRKESSVFFNRLYEALNTLSTRHDSYFDTHRDVNWSNSHTQHSRHEDYDRS